MPDTEFERAFADLAHANLRDKAPGLMDHLVGFQLIEKNDEETHAVAVFGFKVGNQWLYAPVFFMNGALKGSELLYVKSQDIFVPLKDNWVNYLLSKQPYILGANEPQPESALHAYGPDFSPFSGNMTTGKYASVKFAEWAEPFRPALGKLLAGQAKFVGLQLPHFLRKHASLAPKLIATMRKNARLTEIMLNYHKLAELMPKGNEVWICSNCGATYNEKPEACANCSATEITKHVQVKAGPRPDPKSAAEHRIEPKVEIIDGFEFGDTIAQLNLTPAERARLADGKIVIRDHRTNKARVYNADVNRVAQGVVGDGVYDCYDRRGDIRRCTIYTNVVAPCKAEIQGYSVVLDGNTAFVLPTSKIVTAGIGGFVTEPKGTIGVKDMRPNKTYILLGDDQVMVPIVVLARVDANGTTFRIKRPSVDGHVEAVSYSRKSTPPYRFSIPYTYDDSLFQNEILDGEEFKKKYHFDKYDYRSGKDIIIDDRPDAKYFAVSDSDCIVPASWRALEIELGSGDSFHEADPLRFLAKQAGVRLEVRTDGPEIALRWDGNTKSMRKRAALKELVLNWNMDVDVAEKLIKEATAKWTPYLVKQAQPPMGELQQVQPGAPSFPAELPAVASTFTGVPTVEQPAPEFVGVQSMQPTTDRQIYNPMTDTDVQNILSAAARGDKDVFDTAVISGLVKNVDTDELINSMLPDILKGMDRTGRMLFIFYWHNDDFRERYGKQDMMELEDSLRNMFTGLGDLVLFLKQKTIQANPALDELDIKLGD